MAKRPDTIQIARAAKRLTEPVGDDRLKVAGISFGSMLGTCILAWIVMRIWLKRTQRMFGIENAPDLDILNGPAN
jgi:hypothetical protein